MEATGSQQPSPPCHSFLLKKRDRTGEEGVQAIYRMAVRAAVGSNNLPSPPPLAPVLTEELRRTSLHRADVKINHSSIQHENQPSDVWTAQQDQWSSTPQVLEDTQAQGYSRVSPHTPESVCLSALSVSDHVCTESS